MAAGAVEVDITSANAKAGAIFDGVDDKIDLGNSSILKPTQFTITAWVMGSGNYSSVYPHVIKAGAVHCGYGLAFNGVAIITLTIGTGAGTTMNVSALNDDFSYFRFVAGTYDGTTGVIYLDGVEKARNNGSMAYDANNIFIGNRDSDNRYWSGSISDLRMFNRVLTETEINMLYNGEDYKKNLIGQWKLNTDYKDNIGSNDGTNIGSRLGTTDSAIAAAVAADRTTPNDVYLIASTGKNQVVTAVIEEAP